jgi:hypothetical protein
MAWYGISLMSQSVYMIQYHTDIENVARDILSTQVK